ncbi:MAG: class I SAM-dependent methyltransferase [Fibrobacterota bacterium]|nr:class I SAM-dependent methyltransferase [Fibrobacterota bacterium]
MIWDFHAYEKELCRQGLAPLLRKYGFDPAGKSVLDVGCGYGGVLAGLAEAWPLKAALGIDLDADMIREGMAKCPVGMRLEAGDFFGLQGKEFDLILMRDVLEHMPDAEGALTKAASLLAPGGLIFASFAPFYSPFGGHQHNGAGFFSNIPWLQVLPESWFRKALRLDGNSYKSSRGLADDMESVLRARLTLRRFRKMIPSAGLRLGYYARYLSRPDYRIKFGLPEIPFPPIPFLDELACTGIESFLERIPRSA